MSATLRLNWGLNGFTGWGWAGANLARHASLNGWKVSAKAFDPSTLPPTWKLEGWTVDVEPERTKRCELWIAAEGNRSVPDVAQAKGEKNLVMTFLEDTDITPAMVKGYNGFHATIVGSSWNQSLLESAGVRNAHLVHQGADRYAKAAMRVYWEHPDGRVTQSHKRLIFSGGKLEFRKGQDIVVAAFREYLKLDPTAVLVTAWQNAWPGTMKGIDARKHVKAWPQIAPDGSLMLSRWMEWNGVPPENFVDLGIVPSWALQQVMAQCDVAVFPNRAEGGTNLVATECLAVGLPTYATLWTGQRDLANWGAFTLAATDVPPAPCSLYNQMADWREPMLDNVVAAMGPGGTMGHMPPPPSWRSFAEKILSA